MRQVVVRGDPPVLVSPTIEEALAPPDGCVLFPPRRAAAPAQPLTSFWQSG
jgi:hypothetical protein